MNTKILATIGPSSIDKKIMKKMIDVGMNAIRINTSHGNFEQYEKIIKNLRSIKDIPIVLDTQGPEIRLVSKKKYDVNIGKKVTIGFSDESETYFTKNFSQQVKKGDSVYVEDGILNLKVIEVKDNALYLVALTEGRIRNGARVNIPEVNYDKDILSKNDKKVIKFGIKNNVDFIALSYTRDAKDVNYLRRKLENSDIGIISKIENSKGVENIDEIIEVSEGIMVARGDLGVEISSEKLPLIQKKIIKKCNQKGKLVIIATQMLKSMENSSIPTRAETSDVANAILDGTDVVMLSGETAVGKFPRLAVKEMSEIAKEIEGSVKSNVVIDSCNTISEAISKSVYDMTKILPISKVISFTRTGWTAKIISRFRLDVPILAIASDNKVKNKLQLYYGVESIVFPDMPTSQRIKKVTMLLYKKEIVKSTELLLFSGGVLIKKQGSTNLIEVHRCKDILEINRK